VTSAGTQDALDDAIPAEASGRRGGMTTLCRSPEIDVLVEVTGSVEFGAHIILEAFQFGKSVVLMNAEVDATIGPILRVYAKKAWRHPLACEGDEPGVQMNLVRWVKGLGLTHVSSATSRSPKIITVTQHSEASPCGSECIS